MKQKNEKDSIVFINQNAGYLMIDIIHAHTGYKQKTIITGKLVERNNKLDKSVTVRRIITYNRSSAFKRLFTWTWGFIQICWLIKTKYRHSKLFIVSNPPFNTFIPLVCSNHYSMLVYDVYPDALEAYNIFGANSFITKWWKKVNRKVYNKASGLYTITTGMKTLMGNYVGADKIKVVPVWTDNTFLKPIPKIDNPFIRQHQLQDKFLVIYSGNLGHSHPVEDIVNLAAKSNDSDLYFLIIGEGEKKQLIEKMIADYKLTNCQLLPWQSAAMLPNSLAAADVAIVTLDKKASNLSIPSKTYNILSVGTPLLCIADESSALAGMVAEYQLGTCFDAGQTDSMLQYLQQLKNDTDLHTAIKERVLKASEYFGPENAFKFVESK